MDVPARHDPAEDTVALRFALRLCALVMGGAAVAVAGGLDRGELLALAGGLALGLVAPGRWTAAILGAGAAGAAALLVPGTGPGWTAGLVFMGTAAGTWLMHRVEPGERVPWPDAVLAGLGAEALLLVFAFFIVWLAAVVALPFAMIGGAAAFAVGALVFLWMCGSIHVGTGRKVHQMMPERFAAFAAGQGLLWIAFSLAEPESVGAIAVLEMTRLGLIWLGYCRAEAVASAARALPPAPPPPSPAVAPATTASAAAEEPRPDQPAPAAHHPPIPPARHRLRTLGS